MGENHSFSNQTLITETDRMKFRELDSFLNNYDDSQKKAIISDSRNILCIAGAGSGKTSVLVKKIDFLTNYKSVDPSKILAITFTRKAKQEMESRLEALNIKTNVHTFNSFSERILRKYQHKIYNKNTMVLDYSGKVFSFSFAIQSLNLTIDSVIDLYFTDKQKILKTKEELSSILINDCFSIIDFFKLKNKDLSSLSQDIHVENKKIAETILTICKKLQEYIQVYGFRSFNDQILDTLEFFKNNPDYIPQYDYIFVDEYQDVNNSQSKILDLLNPKNLFLVGDPRQSIFGWRGSDINLILNYNKKYPDCETVVLDKNYRSNNHLVNFMNHSIKDLSLRDLESSINGEKNIFLSEHKSEEDEINFITEKLSELTLNKKRIFVLARTNRHLQNISLVMKQKNIHHIIKREDDLTNTGGGNIIISTIHAIKGLESDIVFIMGCNKQNFPCKSSDHPILDFIKLGEYNKEEEEKRLFYVGISRAKHSLYLSYSGKPTEFINEEMISLLEEIPRKDKKDEIDKTSYQDEDFLERDFRRSETYTESKYKEDWEDMISED